MDIGITYDRVQADFVSPFGNTSEYDVEETVLAIKNNLERQGHTVKRIGNAKDLVQRLAAGERWTLVFNACRDGSKTPRVAQVPAILDIFDIPYTFSDVLTLSVTQHPDTSRTLTERAHIPSCNVNCTGRRLLVGIVGSASRARVVGIVEDSMRRAYTHSTDRLATVALSAWRTLDCKDAGIITMRMANDGTPHFVSAEPMANLHPAYSDFAQICRLYGMSYCDLIRGILNEACVRHNINVSHTHVSDQKPLPAHLPNAFQFARL